MPDIDAVLFDAAGTLFVPRPSVGAVYAEVAAQHGVPVDPAALDAGFRAAWREREPRRFAADPTRATSDASERAWWRGTVRRTFELGGAADPGDACFGALFERFAQPDAWRVFDDVRPTLGILRGRGLRVAVVSNFDSRLHRICDGLGLTSLVDFVLPSADVGHAKPATAIFGAACARAGALPSRCLMVGDSPHGDVAGARAAGCQALVLDRSGRPSGEHAIRGLDELPRRLA